jgi:hypothetical protein
VREIVGDMPLLVPASAPRAATSRRRSKPAARACQWLDDQLLACDSLRRQGRAIRRRRPPGRRGNPRTPSTATAEEHDHAHGRPPRKRQSRRPPRQWRRARRPAPRWRPPGSRHHRHRPGRQLLPRHQPADRAQHAEWRRHAGHRAKRPAGQPTAGRRRDRPLRLAGTGLDRGHLAPGLSRQRQAVPGTQAGALLRRHADRLRHRPVGDGAVLLPGRPEGLHRPASSSTS